MLVCQFEAKPSPFGRLRRDFCPLAPFPLSAATDFITMTDVYIYDYIIVEIKVLYSCRLLI